MLMLHPVGIIIYGHKTMTNIFLENSIFTPNIKVENSNEISLIMEFPAIDTTKIVLKSTTINGHPLSDNIILSKDDIELNNVENVAISTWGGSSNLTSLGTITTGVWNSSIIEVPYGGTGVSSITGIIKGNGTSQFSSAVAGSDYISPSGSEIISNKKINPRIYSISTVSTLTPNIDDYDILCITALSNSLTINAPEGDVDDGQVVILRIKDNGTQRNINYSPIYRSMGFTLPSITTISQNFYIICIYNNFDERWDVISVIEES